MGGGGGGGVAQQKRKKKRKKRKVYNLKFSSEKKSGVHVLAYKRLDRERDVHPIVLTKWSGLCPPTGYTKMDVTLWTIKQKKKVMTRIISRLLSL